MQAIWMAESANPANISVRMQSEVWAGYGVLAHSHAQHSLWGSAMRHSAPHKRGCVLRLRPRAPRSRYICGYTISVPVRSHSIRGYTISMPVRLHSIRGYTISVPVRSHSIRGYTISVPVRSHSVRGYTITMPVRSHSVRGYSRGHRGSLHLLPSTPSVLGCRAQHCWVHAFWLACGCVGGYAGDAALSLACGHRIHAHCDRLAVIGIWS